MGRLGGEGKGGGGSKRGEGREGKRKFEMRSEG